jgi:[protein-PII] uridylyltransferase
MSARAERPQAAPTPPPPEPTRAATGVGALRALFREGKAALIDHFMAARATAPAAARLLRALARHVDATLVALWTRSMVPPGATLVAVGGYGRGELFPHSDVDVLVLLPGDDSHAPATEALRAAIAGFLTACWDIGLEIGSSVRTVAECVAEARNDVTIQTAMLESRFLCGQRTLYRDFRRATAEALDPRAFLRAKSLEMQQRHGKYEDTPYSLEPNCKESPGGLRDLQVIVWVGSSARGCTQWQAGARTGCSSTCRPPWPRASASRATARSAAPRC